MRAQLGLGVGLAALATACPPREDVTPLIHVDPRAAQRLGWLGRPAASAAAPEAGPARVHVLKAGEQLGGPTATGRPGDLLLENDEVAFVVAQLGAGVGFAESGGNVIDAADARDRRDELGLLFTYFGTFPRQGVYDALTSGTGADGSAWAQASGHELYEGKLAVTTRYTLRGPDRALLLETTLDNTGEAPVTLPSLGDAVQWGGAEKIAPGLPAGFTGKSSGPYIGGVGRFTSYALTSTDGALDGISGGSWTDTAQRKDVTIPPRGRVSYARVLVVGGRPDSSSLVAELSLAAGQPVGTLETGVTDGALPLGARVALRVEGGGEALSLAAPFAGTVPVGRYRASLGGGAAVGPFEVKAGETTRIALAAPAPARVTARCLEAGAPVPCKVTFEGAGATPTPRFGPGHVAGPAHSQVTTPDGAIDVRLEAGTYRLTASRGPEYTVATADVDVAPGAAWTGAFALDRVVDTSGYLGCDFHQHTMLGSDAPTSLRDRVISNAAEGVEVAVASEHNIVADLEPVVRELHLEARLVEVAGDELTTDSSKHPWGHANVWPLPVDPSSPTGGAPAVHDRSAREVFGALRRSLTGDHVLQVNHPRLGLIGYFNRLGFDPATGVGTDPAYDAGFDALEVWSGRHVEAREGVVGDWCALLRTGHAVTPLATTDTHGVVGEEPGYPRTYVRVADDARLEAWDGARTADVARGVKARRDVVLTNGPMLRVTAGGAAVGGAVRAGAVTVKVHVECAPWIDVDTVRVLLASTGKPVATRAVKLAPVAGRGAPGKSVALGADVTVVVTVGRGDALFVEATGSRPLTPVLGGDSKELLPWAMTGAIAAE